MKNGFYIVNIVVVSMCLLLPKTGFSQFNDIPIPKDSVIIKGWATGCTVYRGYINIEDTTETYTQGDSTSNRTFFGLPENTTGYPQNGMDVVSLGDGGCAVLSFDKPLKNGEGPDFAVFENGFVSSEPPYQYFLELAFVEVSTDGIRYVRFPAVSLTQDTMQIPTYGQLSPENLHNLAGKFPVDLGTPFDLEEIKDSSGINIDSINFVKIVDVVGDINPLYASYDIQGNKINDPWPSPFWTGGFDLNAVAVINVLDNTDVVARKRNITVNVMPNPADLFLRIKTTGDYKISGFTLTDISGKTVLEKKNANGNVAEINTSCLHEGIYFLKVFTGNALFYKKFIIKH